MVPLNDKRFNITFIDIILKAGSLQDEEFKMLEKMMLVASKKRNWHVPYEVITEKIYEGSFDSGIIESIDQKLGSYEFKDVDREFVEKVTKDILRNVELAITQKEYIDKNMKTASEKLKEIDTEFKEIQDTKSKIYTDFITILGIFTAITFAIFGGLQLIGNSLKNLGGPITSQGVGSILIIASIILLSVYLILVVLLTGLSKLLSGSKNKRYKFTGKITTCVIVTIVGLFSIGCLFVFL